MLFILKGKRYARMVMNIHLWFLKDPLDFLGEKKSDSIGKRHNGKTSEEVITQIQEKIMVVVQRW